jgi:hypothetical protein
MSHIALTFGDPDNGKAVGSILAARKRLSAMLETTFARVGL